MRIARVFPRRTRATPGDDLVFIGEPGLYPPEVDKVQISVSFTWDIPEAERLALTWQSVAPTEVGGPALKTPAGEFMPGQFLRHGYTITSRGCPLKCWFCPVWKAEPQTIELPIKDGWLIQDDNFLACSEQHVRAVFAMLKRQPRKNGKSQVQFTGGLEPAFLKDWHVDLLADLKPAQIFSAYDTPDDLEPLIEAGRMLQAAGFKFSHKTLRSYVLIGYEKDTLEAADKRMHEVIDAGFWPMAMLWRDPHTGKVDKSWARFQRLWSRPAIMYARLNPKTPLYVEDQSGSLFSAGGSDA